MNKISALLIPATLAAAVCVSATAIGNMMPSQPAFTDDDGAQAWLVELRGGAEPYVYLVNDFDTMADCLEAVDGHDADKAAFQMECLPLAK